MKNIFKIRILIVLTIIFFSGFAGCSSAPKSAEGTPFEGNFSGISGDGFTEMIFIGNILEIKVNGISNARGSFTYSNNTLTWNMTHAYIPRNRSMAQTGVFEMMIIYDSQYRLMKIPLVKTTTTWEYKLDGDRLFLSNYQSGSAAMGININTSIPGDFPPLTRNVSAANTPKTWTHTYPYAITIMSGYKGYGGNIAIPGTIQNTPVVSIGPSSLSASAITQVQIPPNVRFIDMEAFSLNHLTKVDIPDNILLIGSKAFLKNSISELIIGKSVAVIGAEAFAENPINKITIKNPDIFIFDNAFDTDFKAAFQRHGIGTYSYNNGIWSLER